MICTYAISARNVLFEIFGASHTVSKSPPMSKPPPLMVHLFMFLLAIFIAATLRHFNYCRGFRLGKCTAYCGDCVYVSTFDGKGEETVDIARLLCCYEDKSKL